MLEQVVKEIRAGGTLETRALATRLGTSPQLIEAMLEHLQRTGLIQPYVHSIEACGECGLRGSCGARSDRGIRLWQGVAERGSEERTSKPPPGLCDVVMH